jgi:hypothetical protein
MALEFSLTRLPCSTAPKHFFYFCLDSHFWYRLSKPQGLVWQEGLGKLIKFNYLIGSWTPDLATDSAGLCSELLAFCAVMMCRLGHSVSGLCQSSGILNTRNHDILETGLFPSSGERKETPTLLGTSDIANLDHGAEEGNRSSFRNVEFSSYLELRTIEKVHKTSDSECYIPSSEPFIFNYVVW